ncbi:hypothetical protein ACFSUK_08010 [Sphingobium scionense]|uniref:Uncharacterized protein n=1 Tax=Sphingobium scionense TaxID=1404341 RepID=A0A7W6PWD8_9SPHN|nr:hypothetical protein [Sphingobium scionense]MBB4149099.1 hypothetical protein [Sphingobium scionense]
MKTDRLLLSEFRAALHDMDSDLIGVRLNICPGARSAAIERARAHLRAAIGELTDVMAGPLLGDRTAA